MNTNTLKFEALFSPQEPLKVKILSNFLGVDFSISENGSAVNVLTGPHENFKNSQKCPDVLYIMYNDEKTP